MSRQEQQVEQAEQVVTQEVLQIRRVVIQRLNALEQEIREIRKAVIQEEYFPEFPAIKQVERDSKNKQEEFNCTLCSVTKPIDQRERKGKQKSSVCKHCANNRLNERHQKSKNDGMCLWKYISEMGTS